MSTGLMSCVRENSPPLEMATAATEQMGAVSLSPSVNSTEQTKRRRFHPLRNLRRIFRRRTLTSPIGSGNNDVASNTTQSNTTTPIHNSSSVLLQRTIPNLTLSSPSSPAANSTISQFILMQSPTVTNYNINSSSMEQEQLQQYENSSHQYFQQQQLHQQQQSVPALSPKNSQSIMSLTIQELQHHQELLHSQSSTSNHQSSNSRSNNNGLLERSPRAGGVKILPSGFSLNFNPSSSDSYYNYQQQQQHQQQQQQSSNSSSTNISVNSPRQCDNKIIMNKISTNKNESNDELNESVVNDSNLNRNYEMTDNQRSLSEGRLIDSDFNRDPLSQSHDSVFSETASSFSMVLKNELFDVLRKRRNRPDTSDEDLGLPRSPSTPQRKDLTLTATQSSAITTSTSANSSSNIQNQSEISSLSLLSAGSSDIDEDISSNYGDSMLTDRSVLSNLSSSLKVSQSTSYETSKSHLSSDDYDFSTTDGVSPTGRLSHSAAKHKMAIRPKKNKGPTRQRRIEPTLLPSTPEVNEDSLRMTLSSDFKDLSNKEKSRSLPHGVNPKLMNQQNDSLSSINSISNKESNIKRSKTEKESNSYIFRHITKSSTCDKDLNVQKSQSDTGFFKRFLHRGSKGKGTPQSTGSAHHISSNSMQHNLDENDDIDFSESFEEQNREISIEYSKQVEQTRNEIRREIMNEANTGLSLMLNNFILSKSDSNTGITDKITTSPIKPAISSNKPKSGPAARQRIMPKDISTSPDPNFKTSTDVLEQHLNSIPQPQQTDEESKNNKKHRFSDSSDGSKGSMELLKLSNISLSSSPDYKYMSKSSHMNSSSEEVFNSKTFVKEKSESRIQTDHFEKHHNVQSKTINSYQQKMHRSENLLDNLLEPPKQRKGVEKSKSFRLYNGSQNFEVTSSLQKSENMPSLPDLTFSRKSFEDLEHAEEASLSLGFEINDNNLIKKSGHTSNSGEDDTFPLRQGIFTKNIILTTVNPKQSKNISEIEDSIDKLLVKSPPQLSRNSSNSNEIKSKTSSANVIVTHMYQKNNLESTITQTESQNSSTSISIRAETDKPVRAANRRNSYKSESINESLDSLETKKQPVNAKQDHKNNEKIQPIKVSVTPRKNEEKSNEFLKESRKSVDLDEIKKVFTPKSDNTDRISTVIKQNSREDEKDDSKSNDRDSKVNGNKYNRSQSHPEIESSKNGVPEFMKIQLNKIAEPCRTKTNVVLSKIIKAPVETDRSQSTSPPQTPTTESRPSSTDKNPSETKPPLPPLPTELEKKRNSYVLSTQENTTISTTTTSSTNKSNLATSRLRKSFEEDEVVILRNNHTTTESSKKFERRKSVNDEKIKYEKKIEEMQKIEKPAPTELKKSFAFTDDNNLFTNSTTMTSNDVTMIPVSVLMRKKSLSLGNQMEKNKDDSTPELMKVFARRSLKIKDEDVQAFIDETSSDAKNKSTKSAFTSGTIGGGNLDSDKENQSSSDEKLNKLTKQEQNIQQNIQNNQKLIGSNNYGQKNMSNQRENIEKNSKIISNNSSSLSSTGNAAFTIFNNSKMNNTNSTGVLNSPTKAFNRFHNNSSNIKNNNNSISNNSNNINNNNNNITANCNRYSLSALSSSVNNNNNNSNNNISNNNNNNNNSVINNNCNNQNNNNNNNKSDVALRTSNVSQKLTTVKTPSPENLNNRHSDSKINSNSNNNNNNCVINSINNKNINTRHTIGPTSAIPSIIPPTTTTTTTNKINEHKNQTTITTTKITPLVVKQQSDIEYKGILQRRAEWEKRVKEAAK